MASPIAIVRVLLEADDVDPYAAKDPYAAGDPYSPESPKPESPKPADDDDDEDFGREEIYDLITVDPLDGIPVAESGGNRFTRLLGEFQRRRRRITHIKLGANTWADFHGDLTNPTEPGNYINVTLYETVIARLEPDGSGTYWNGRGVWASPLTLDRITPWLAGGWQIYTWANPKDPIPPTRRRRQGKWYWYNTATRAGTERLPRSRQPFTDGDHIDAQGRLHPKAKPILFKRRGLPEIRESMGGKPGVYADLTGPKPQYYAKCPECGHVHGMYPSFAAATAQKICNTCQFERVMKYKSDLEKLGRPKKRSVREEVDDDDENRHRHQGTLQPGHG